MSDAEARDEATVEAVGLVTEALECVERARGHLYSFHQLIGHADALVADAAEALRASGHRELAERIDTELVGRNVVADQWTFQVVEEFDDIYWTTFRRLEADARTELTGGRRHLHEARLKRRRRTVGHPEHSASPTGQPGIGDGRDAGD